MQWSSSDWQSKLRRTLRATMDAEPEAVMEARPLGPLSQAGLPALPSPHLGQAFAVLEALLHLAERRRMQTETSPAAQAHSDRCGSSRIDKDTSQHTCSVFRVHIGYVHMVWGADGCAQDPQHKFQLAFSRQLCDCIVSSMQAASQCGWCCPWSIQAAHSRRPAPACCRSRLACRCSE